MVSRRKENEAERYLTDSNLIFLFTFPKCLFRAHDALRDKRWSKVNMVTEKVYSVFRTIKLKSYTVFVQCNRIRVLCVLDSCVHSNLSVKFAIAQPTQ